MSYRIKASDYGKAKESIPIKEQTSISPCGISQAEIEAARKVLSSNQKMPSFELPTFHFYDKSMEVNEAEEVNEISDETLYRAQSKAQHLRDKAGRTAVQMQSKHHRKVALGKAAPFSNTPEHQSFIKHDDEKRARHKQAQKFFDYRQKKKGAEVKEANMGGPNFTWNKDSKAFHNPHPTYSKDAVDKEIKKDKRIGGKEAKKIHALLKGWRGHKKTNEGAVQEVSDELLYRAQSKAAMERDKEKGHALRSFSKHLNKIRAGKASPGENTKEYQSFMKHDMQSLKRHDQAVKFFAGRQRKKSK